jgi:hypothetical protein
LANTDFAQKFRALAVKKAIFLFPTTKGQRNSKEFAIFVWSWYSLTSTTSFPKKPKQLL